MRNIVLLFLVAMTGLSADHESREQALARWKANDATRPVPPVITPAALGRAPAGSVSHRNLRPTLAPLRAPFRRIARLCGIGPR